MDIPPKNVFNIGDSVKVNGGSPVIVDYYNYTTFTNLNFNFDKNMWTDVTMDGVFNYGDKVDDKDVDEENFFDFFVTPKVNFSTGEWDWNNSNPNNNTDLIFDSGEWHWKDDDGGDGPFTFNSGSWKPTLLPDAYFKVVYSEWYDYPTCDGIFEEGEIKYTLDVDDVYYLYNEMTNEWKPSSADPLAQRIGASIWKIDGKIYLVAGNNSVVNGGTANNVDILRFDGSTWTAPISNSNFDTRNFAFSFVIGNKAYIGAGENSAGEVIPADLWEFWPGLGNRFQSKRSCGVSKLTRSVGFSLEDKGYVGFGKTDNDGGDPFKEFWMYVPCLKECE